MDAKGFKTRTEYRLNEDGQRVKVTKKIRVVRRALRDNDRIRRRQEIPKFGEAAGIRDEGTVTIQVQEEVGTHQFRMKN